MSFQFLIVRLKVSTGDEIVLSGKFQFLIVRLKDFRMPLWILVSIISIPYSSIKRRKYKPPIKMLVNFNSL